MTIGNRIGLVVNARNAWPDDGTLSQLGNSWLRTIVYNFDDLDRVVQTVGAGTRIIALLNSETEEVGSNYENWHEAVDKFAARFGNHIEAVECGNEWDQHGMSPYMAAWLAHSAGYYLHSVGIKSLLGSVSGPEWQSNLEQAYAQLHFIKSNMVDGVCFHPYGKNAFDFPGYPFGDIKEAVQQASQLAGDKPVYVTEFGGPMGELQGAFGQSKYLNNCFNELGQLPRSVLAAACYFCWRDDVGAPDQRNEETAFGLVTVDGQERPAMQAYYALCRRSLRADDSV